MAPAKLGINIIGSGKAASALVRRWVIDNLVAVCGVHNRSVESANKAVEFFGHGYAVRTLKDIYPTHLLLIGVPDQVLPEIVRELTKRSYAVGRATVFHLSGSWSSEILAPLRQFGASVASLHPIMTFADPARAVEQLIGCAYTVEGDEQACQVLTGLVQKSKGTAWVISPEVKPLYHAGLVFACNYLPVLLQKAVDVLAAAGIGQEKSLSALRPLIQATVENCFRLGLQKALTGPVARGDAEVVRAEIDHLTRVNKEWAFVYKVLAREALALAASGGLIPETKRERLARLLELSADDL